MEYTHKIGGIYARTSSKDIMIVENLTDKGYNIRYLYNRFVDGPVKEPFFWGNYMMGTWDIPITTDLEKLLWNIVI